MVQLITQKLSRTRLKKVNKNCGRELVIEPIVWIFHIHLCNKKKLIYYFHTSWLRDFLAISVLVARKGRTLFIPLSFLYFMLRTKTKIKSRQLKFENDVSAFVHRTKKNNSNIPTAPMIYFILNIFFSPQDSSSGL